MNQKIKKLYFYFLTFVLATSLNTELLLSLESKKVQIEQEKEKNSDDILKELRKKKKSLSKEAEEKIETICAMDTSESVYLDLLEITKDSIPKYQNNKEQKIKRHQNTSFYEEESSSIDWDQLAKKIYDNGRKKCFWNLQQESMSKDEIVKKLETMKKLVLKMQKDFPDYDIKPLACNLEEASMVKSREKEDPKTLAEVVDHDIIYYEQKEGKEQLLIDCHEDFHYAINACTDQKTEAYYNPKFHYSFLEEIYAELYAAEVTETKQMHYMRHDEVLATLQLVLGLENSYQIDSMLEYMVYRDPCDLLESFPLYSKSPSDDWIKNCEMLKSIDLLLRKSAWYDKKLKEKNLEEEYKEKGVYELEQSAMNHLASIFFNNLIVRNETKDLSLEDNYSFMRLFEEYFFRMNVSLSKSAKKEYDLPPEAKTFFIKDSLLKSYQSIMFDYLEEKYQEESTLLKEEYNNYRVTEEKEFPKDLGEDKLDFYQSLTKEMYQYEEPYSIPLQKRKVHNSLTNG